MSSRGKGFTLIELLIVIAVIGVMAIVVAAAINPLAQTAKARDAKRKTDLASIKAALQSYYTLNGQYPDHCNGTFVYSAYPQPWFPDLVTSGELKTVPVDPKNTWTYPDGTKTFTYQYQSKDIGKLSSKTPGFPCDTQHFVLGTHLENSNDSAINWDFTDFYSGWFVNYVVTDTY